MFSYGTTMKHQTLLFNTITLVIANVLLNIGDAGGLKFLSSKNKVLYNQIFTDKASLKPIETEILLKRLSDLEQDNTAAESHFWHSRCIPDATNCNFARFDLRLFELDTQVVGNLRSYLDYCIEKQYLACKEKLSQNLIESVNKLDGDDIRDIELLDQCFITNRTGIERTRAIGGRFDIQYANSALKAFYEARPHWEDKTCARPDETKFVTWRQLKPIEKLCDRVGRQLGHAWWQFQPIENKRAVVRHFDDCVLDWIPRLALCDRIIMYIIKQESLAQG